MNFHLFLKCFTMYYMLMMQREFILESPVNIGIFISLFKYIFDETPESRLLRHLQYASHNNVKRPVKSWWATWSNFIKTARKCYWYKPFGKQKSRPPELMADANYLGELSPPHSPARMRKSSSVRRDYVRPFIQGPDPTFGRCFIWHNLLETPNLDLSSKGLMSGKVGFTS